MKLLTYLLEDAGEPFVVIVSEGDTQLQTLVDNGAIEAIKKLLESRAPKKE